MSDNKFRHKSKGLVVEAIQWRLKNALDVAQFFGHDFKITENGYSVILEGNAHPHRLAHAFDWIVRISDEPEVYSTYTPLIFSSTFEKIYPNKKGITMSENEDSTPSEVTAALDTLKELMEDKALDAGIRLQAAQAIISRVDEDDLQDYMEARMKAPTDQGHDEPDHDVEYTDEPDAGLTTDQILGNPEPEMPEPGPITLEPDSTRQTGMIYDGPLPTEPVSSPITEGEL